MATLLKTTREKRRQDQQANLPSAHQIESSPSGTGDWVLITQSDSHGEPASSISLTNMAHNTPSAGGDAPSFTESPTIKSCDIVLKLIPAISNSLLSMNLRVHPYTSVDRIIHGYKIRMGLGQARHIYLIFKGKKLNDGSTVADVGLQDRDCVVVVDTCLLSTTPASSSTSSSDTMPGFSKAVDNITDTMQLFADYLEGNREVFARPEHIGVAEDMIQLAEKFQQVIVGVKNAAQDIGKLGKETGFGEGEGNGDGNED